MNINYDIGLVYMTDGSYLHEMVAILTKLIR